MRKCRGDDTFFHVKISCNSFVPYAHNIIASPNKTKGETKMKGITTQQGRETLNRFKMEAASEVGVDLKQGYNGDLTSREAGSVGGQMVKKMIDAYKMGNKQ